MNEKFGKKEKLKNKRLIDDLFNEGKSIKKFPLKLIYLPLETSEDCRLQTGISVPKKLVKTAVARNRIKRLIREVFRKNKYLVTSNIPRPYAFMIIYISREKAEYENLNKAMIKLLNSFMEKEKSNI